MKGLKFIITADIAGNEQEIAKEIEERGRYAILEDAKEVMEQVIKDEFGDLENVQVSVGIIN